MAVYRVGECRDCGACCYILYPDGQRRICGSYNVSSKKHCRNYAKRPKACRIFPRGPMDLERVSKWCGFSFVDEKGRVLDSYMDKRVKLIPVAGR